MKRKKQQHGFTMIEAIMAAMLLGVVIAALAAASGAFTMANGYGIDLSTAEFLIEQIRERATNMDFTTLAASDGVSYNPPIDMEGTSLTDFSAFTQAIDVDHMQAGNLDQIDASGTSDFVRVTVTITKDSVPLNSTSWIRANLD